MMKAKCDTESLLYLFSFCLLNSHYVFIMLLQQGCLEHNHGHCLVSGSPVKLKKLLLLCKHRVKS